MAGQKSGKLKEKMSPFLKKMREKAVRGDFAKREEILRVIDRQYRFDESEEVLFCEERRRHYEADVYRTFEGRPVKGVERLYKRTIIIEPTTICAAHCRWCLRGQYDIMHLSEEEIETVARYCGEAEETRDVREALITGGDPLMIPDRLEYLMDSLHRYASQINVFRIGTRVPIQDPARVNRELVEMMASYSNASVELGIHVNHPCELFPEVTKALYMLVSSGITIYNQTVLLKGVNDDLHTLVELYEALRHLGVESHYLFHCIPMKGMNHHRTTVAKGLELIRGLSSSGYTSGRCKPVYTLMTDVGKVSLYEGTIQKRDDVNNMLLLRTGYKYEDRINWNPHWELPSSAQVCPDGTLSVWYRDAE